MSPEEGMRLFNNVDEWNLELRERVLPRGTGMPDVVRAILTVGAVVVVAVVAVALFVSGVRTVREPPALLPASPTPAVTATLDDGFVMSPQYLAFANPSREREERVELGSNESYPWALIEPPLPKTKELYVSWVGGGGGGACGGHIGMNVVETRETITIAAVSSPRDKSAACTDQLNLGDGRVDLSEPLGDRQVFHAALTPGKEIYKESLLTVPAFTFTNFGDLRIGQPVPEDGRLVRWNPEKCGSGWWDPLDPNLRIVVRTEKSDRRGAITSISIGSPGFTPTGSVWSGITVGMTESQFENVVRVTSTADRRVRSHEESDQYGAIAPTWEDGVVTWLNILPPGGDWIGLTEDCSG